MEWFACVRYDRLMGLFFINLRRSLPSKSRWRACDQRTISVLQYLLRKDIWQRSEGLRRLLGVIRLSHPWRSSLAIYQSLKWQCSLTSTSQSTSNQLRWWTITRSWRASLSKHPRSNRSYGVSRKLMSSLSAVVFSQQTASWIQTM